MSVPDRGPRSIVLVATAGAPGRRPGRRVRATPGPRSGCRRCSTGATDGQLRVAPISHAGELLGLHRGRAARRRPTRSPRRTTGCSPSWPARSAWPSTTSSSTPPCRPPWTSCGRQADELRESRARIVASGDAERRRVERNLHDGAQQHLVALAVNLRLAKDIIVDDPEAPAEMLDAAGRRRQGHDPGAARAGPRHLPAAAGRQRARRGAAGRGQPQPARRRRAAPTGSAATRPSVEAAVYFCCLEALQNAAKHAPDAHVEVRVWEESGGLLFTVADDGPGFDAARGPAAATASSTWPTGSVRSAARCAGSRSPARDDAGARARSRCT